MPLFPPVYGYATVEAFGNVPFTDPVAIVSPPGETNRLFVVEQGGRVAVITNLANPNRTVFLDISDKITGGVPSDERGVLGLAFHPGYATNRFFYLYYVGIATTSVPGGTDAEHDILARFQTTATNANVALADTEVRLLVQYDEAVNHNAGDLHFGPDGYLYVSLGDEGGQSDVFDNSQRIDKDFFSGILRLDVDRRPGSLAPNFHPASTTNYAVPSDNPFVGAANFNGESVNPTNVRTEFWAVGLRNPWRFSFDPATGHLYCGDVGENAREEVNIITKGGNYGWAFREGTIAGPKSGQAPGGFTGIEPIQEYTHGDAADKGYAVIGGVVYRGDRISQLTGAYVFSDYGGNVWMLRYDGTNTTPFQRLFLEPAVSAFGIDPRNGDVLMASQTAGRIFRLVYSDQLEGGTLPATLADTGAFTNLATLAPDAGILPYDINVPFWSDNAIKSRWFSVPETSLAISFAAQGNWSFPNGTVWIKHFDLQLTNGVPASRKRVETRFIVKNDSGVYGVTYRWGNSLTNATLVPNEGLDESFVINEGGGILRTQVWHYPGRGECLRCHSRVGGYALGFNTPQMNRAFDYDGVVTNQILALSQAGYYATNVTDVGSLPALAQATNSDYSLEYRARSYLSANCVQCHQPGGAGFGAWDARIATPALNAGIINGTLTDNLGDPNNRVIAPGSLGNSAMYSRVANLGVRHMPPLATTVPNAEAISLLSQWIISLGNISLGNTAPVLPAQTNRTLQESMALTVTNTATDPEGNNLNYVLVQAPATAAIDTSGVITWTPAEADGPSANEFTTVVTDDGTNHLSATNTFFVVVSEVNEPPVLALPADTNIHGLVAFAAMATATDGDIPANSLTFELVSGPSNLTVAADGLINWTPNESQSPGANTVTVKVTDTNPPAVNATSLSVTGSFQIVVGPLLTVFAHDMNRLYGHANPVFSGTLTGVQNGDNIVATYSSSATTSSPVGNYDIVPALIDPDGKLANYTVIVTNGTLTIVDMARPLSIAEATEGTFILEWRVYPGRKYRCDYKTNLSDTNWTALSEATAVSSRMVITNNAGTNLQGFFRMVDITVP